MDPPRLYEPVDSDRVPVLLSGRSTSARRTEQGALSTPRDPEQRVSAHQSDIKGLQFIGRSHGGSDPAKASESAVEFRRLSGALLAGALGIAGFGVVTWLITQTGALARLFLLGVAGLFGLALALGVFIVSH
ncbi:MAG: hypothetical protein V5A55_07890 [Halovenus sp.]